ncbi:MAG: NINE protein [Candidatus Pacebacteria bacterium]|nr:NINE protein [Candidatus Paceibacterota bacterium]
MKKCPFCAEEVQESAVVCKHCGRDFNHKPQTQRDWVTLVLLSFFLGVLGVDRFYMGRTGLGLFKLLTFGGLGLFALIDFFLALLNKMKDVNGKIAVKK